MICAISQYRKECTETTDVALTQSKMEKCEKGRKDEDRHTKKNDERETLTYFLMTSSISAHSFSFSLIHFHLPQTRHKTDSFSRRTELR